MIGRIRAALRVRRAGRLYARKSFDAAAEEMEAAAKERPGLPEYAQYAGVIALKRGRFDEAERLLLEAEKAGADPFVVQQALGAVEMARGRHEKALERFSAALALFPVAFEVGYHIGLAKLAAGRTAEARAEFTALLSKDDEALFKRLQRIS